MAKNVLVIDDEPEDLNTIKRVLEKEGYEVKEVTDGAQALESLNENKFDIILIDIQMPTLSGYDLLRLLRERINHKSKMVYISIVPEREVDMSDTDGFIQKPFSPESLLEGVKKALG